jgi:hypothetical protein
MAAAQTKIRGGGGSLSLLLRSVKVGGHGLEYSFPCLFIHPGRLLVRATSSCNCLSRVLFWLQSCDALTAHVGGQDWPLKDRSLLGRSSHTSLLGSVEDLNVRCLR